MALGGLTDGVTTVEMAAAYSAFANGGIYHKPYTYTEVKDSEGNLLLKNDTSGKVAMKASTAFLMTQMLREVVTSGTGGGAGVSGVSYTAGKTGTTSDNNDRWFVGYTPYYAAAIWYGYDIPKEIRVSSNPCITVFRNVMNDIHKTLDDRGRYLSTPSGVTSLTYCTYTGLLASEECPTDTYYFQSSNIPGKCDSTHPGYEPEEEGLEDEGAEGESETTNPANSSSTEKPSAGTTTNESDSNVVVPGGVPVE